MPNERRKDVIRPGGALGVAWAAKRAAEAPPLKPVGGQGIPEAAPITLPRVVFLEAPEVE
jgi:hypothetical protein